MTAEQILIEALEDVADIIQGGDRFESLEPWAQEIVNKCRTAIQEAKEAQS